QRRVRRLLSLQQDSGLQQLDIGKSLLEVSRDAVDSGLFVPSELALLGKTLLQLDEVGRILDPGFDPNESVRRNVNELMMMQMRKTTSKAGVIGALLEAKHLVATLPAQVNKVMDLAANGQFEVKVKSVDAGTVVEGIQKVANRIAAGVILAALIIGAALLM